MHDRLKSTLRRLDSIVNYFTGAGSSVDKGRTNAISNVRHYDEDRLEAFWRQNQYAGVAVDELVLEAVRRGWSVTTADDPDIMSTFDDEFDVVDRFVMAATYGRIMGGAVLVMVTDDTEDLTEPLNVKGAFNIDNIVMFDRRELSPASYTTNMRDKNYGRVEVWSIHPVTATDDPYLQVHHTRVLFFGGQPVSRVARVDNDGFDDSILLRTINAIFNKTNIDNARATIVQNFVTNVVKTGALDAIGTADEQLSYFDERMQQLARGVSNIGHVVLDADEEYIKQTTSVAGLSELNDRASDEVSTALRMSKQRLNGDAPSGLSTDGSSGRNNWHDQVAAFQTHKLRPLLHRLYTVVFAAKNGPTKGVTPPEWGIEFEPLDELTEQGKANVRKTVAETDAIYMDRGALSPDQVLHGRFGADGWNFELPVDPEIEDEE